MLLEKEKFRFKFFDDIKKVYTLSRMEGEFIVIIYSHFEMSIPTADAYDEYRLCKDYGKIKNLYLRNIKSLIDDHKFIINYDIVFPLIKNKDFGKDESLNFVREPFVLDLDILYVCDMGETYRFLLKEDDYNFDKLKDVAIKNLNKMTNILVKLDEELEIYTLSFASDLSPSFLLSKNFMEKIYKKVGKRFLFIIPSSTTLVIAKDINIYINMLKDLIESEEDIQKVSSHVYRYNNGTYTYADMENAIKVIK